MGRGCAGAGKTPRPAPRAGRTRHESGRNDRRAGQFSAGTDKAKNTTAAGRLIAEAAAAGADLVVLPESSLYGTSEPATAIAAVAEDLDGPFIRRIAAFANEHPIAVVVGTCERPETGLPYNTLVALDSSGNVVGCYRKVHLYDAFGYRESGGISAGNAEEPFVFSLGGYRRALSGKRRSRQVNAPKRPPRHRLLDGSGSGRGSGGQRW